MPVARRLLLQYCVNSLEFVQEALSDLSFVALLHLGGRQQQPHKYRTAIASGAFVKKWKGSLHIVTLNVPSGDFCKLRLHQCFSSNWNVCILEVYSTCWMLFQETFCRDSFCQHSSSLLLLWLCRQLGTFDTVVGVLLPLWSSEMSSGTLKAMISSIKWLHMKLHVI